MAVHKLDAKDYKFAVGDIVATTESVSTYDGTGKRKGSALVGWKWKVFRHLSSEAPKRVYLLCDPSGMYWTEVKEERIWKLWDKLTDSEKATAQAGKEIKTK